MTLWHSVWCVLKGAILNSPTQPSHVPVCLFCASTKLRQHLDKLDKGTGSAENKSHHKTKTNQAKPTATKHAHHLAA